ncbi:MAG: tyrosine--tRNA ligase, partial [Anaerolineae bacterium]|nr:tyrosine--tRNA ligase [Anaerolineae bacterium]
MAKLSEILRERGYVYQHSSETLEEITDGPPRTVYEGFDPSADSLHVGNLMGMLVLRRFLEAGHKVIIVVGGGTGMIGDPSGKSEERNLLDEATISHNVAALHVQAEYLFGGLDFTIVNNADWLDDLKMIDFLRDIGKSFSVNAMLQRDSVKARLENQEQGISYAEFSYMLLQAYDFLYLHEKYGCDWQHGSSDQWGNIVSGIDLIRRHTGETVYGTTHGLLINTSTGKKFGKSESGAIWLDAAKTSVFDFYQFWINTEDEMLEEYLLKMTMVSKSDIDAVMAGH